MVLVFRTPDSACPSSHLVLLSSCSSHHLPTPHTSCNIPGSSGFLAKCSRSWTEPPTCQLPHMASTSDSLAMRSLSELPSGILGDGALGLGGALPALPGLGSTDHSPCPSLPLPSDTSLQSSPSIQGIKDQCWGSASPHPQLY